MSHNLTREMIGRRRPVLELGCETAHLRICLDDVFGGLVKGLFLVFFTASIMFSPRPSCRFLTRF